MQNARHSNTKYGILQDRIKRITASSSVLTAKSKIIYNFLA